MSDKKPGEYMYRELREGPSKVLETLREARRDAEEAARIIGGSPHSKAYIIGSGTSFHASLYLAYLLNRYTAVHAIPVPASEFEDWIPLGRRDYVIVGYSQSGESSDIVAAFTEASKAGVATVAITNTPGSTLTKISSASIVTRAGEEKAVAATKTFDVQLAAALMLASLLSGKEFRIEDAAREAEGVIGREEEVEALAERYKCSSHAFTLGKAAAYPVALEAALKMKEASMVHAEGFAAREFLHGPVQLVDGSTPVFFFAPSREGFEASVKALEKVSGYGAPIVAVGPRHGAFQEKASAYIEVGLEGEAAVIPLVKAAQLYAYHLAVLKGLDPDRPSKLTKVVKY